MQNQNPKKYDKITISFTEADSDIIEYVKKLKKSGKASEFTREAIREKINKEEVSNKNNEQLISKLENMEKKITDLIEKNLLNGDTSTIFKDNDKVEVKTEKDNNEIIEEKNINEKDNKIKENDKIEIDNDLDNALNFFDF